MFEGGVLPRVPAGGAAGTLGAPAEDASEDVVGLLGSLAAGGALAGVVEGLLARLLVTAQNPNDDEDDDGDKVGLTCYSVLGLVGSDATSSEEERRKDRDDEEEVRPVK